MFRLIFFMSVIFFLYTLGYTNAEEQVVIRYFWGWKSVPIRIDLLIMACFLSGTFMAIMFTLPGWIRMRLDLRHKRRTIEQLEGERDRLRAQQTVNEPQAQSPFSYKDDQEEI